MPFAGRCLPDFGWASERADAGVDRDDCAFQQGRAAARNLPLRDRLVEMQENVPVPGDLGEGEIQRIAATRSGWSDEHPPDPIPPRPHVRAEELVPSGVEREPAARLVAARERLLAC